MTNNVQPAKKQLDVATAEMLVLGGAVLGRGGGGRFEAGLRLGQLALELGDAFLVDLSDCLSEPGLIGLATFRASVSETGLSRPRFYSRAIELLATNTATTITGLINCGSGAVDTMVGWVQAALLGLPLIDVAFDALTHPIPVFDLMYRWADNDSTLAMAVVGQPLQKGRRLEIFVQGASSNLIDLLREVAGTVNGEFAVAVGPLPGPWVQAQGCVGLISRTIEIGRTMKQIPGSDGWAAARIIRQALQGQRQVSGTVTRIRRSTIARRVYRIISLKDSENQFLELLWWHRYLSLDIAGRRVATFPDIVVTLGSRGTPLSAEELGQGQDIHIVIAAEPIPISELHAQWETVYQDIEDIIGKSDAAFC